MFSYFDHNATTPIGEKVLQSMLPYFKDDYGNASSRHALGTKVREAINRAREQVAHLVEVQASQVIFVSGGTEANNAFIKGMGACLPPSQVISSSMEHPCVKNPVQKLRRSGWKLTNLPTLGNGLVDASNLDVLLSSKTGFASVMLANNETGVIQPISKLAESFRQHNVWFHTDAVQAVGKIPLTFAGLGVHAMSISAHKLGGPKGIGALVIDKRLPLEPLIDGGGHEFGLRSGTENVPAIVGFGVACEIASEKLKSYQAVVSPIRDKIEADLESLGAVIFGKLAPRLPNTLYCSFPGVHGESMVIALNEEGFGVASGSACSSASVNVSPTLLAMGVEESLASCAVRISVGEESTIDDAERFHLSCRRVLKKFNNLMALAS